MMAELLGRATGYSGGKGGSMHIADMDKHMLGANGIVGGGMGLATGAALTAKLQKTGAVAICFFGDGALEQGILHETTNMAAIWKLPVVFVCENNQYAMSARSDWSIAGGDPASRAAGYGIPGVTRRRHGPVRGQSARERVRRARPARRRAEPIWSATRTASTATTPATRSTIARRKRSSAGGVQRPDRTRQAGRRSSGAHARRTRSSTWSSSIEAADRRSRRVRQATVPIRRPTS